MNHWKESRDKSATLLRMQPSAEPARGERRRYPRYPCQARATLHPRADKPGTDVLMTDISLGGCYLETGSVCPVGSIVVVKFQLFGVPVGVEGKVTTSHPMVGMGISFESASEELRAMVKLLAEGGTDQPASSEPAVEAKAEAEKRPILPVQAPVMLTSQQTHQLLRDLLAWFEQHDSLERDTFAELLQSAIFGGRLQR